MPHCLEDSDAGGGGDGGIDRHSDTWKAIGESLLRTCLGDAAEVRRRMINLRQRPLASASPVGEERERERAILSHRLEEVDARKVAIVA